jgi:hypothetical protein
MQQQPWMAPCSRWAPGATHRSPPCGLSPPLPPAPRRTAVAAGSCCRLPTRCPQGWAGQQWHWRPSRSPARASTPPQSRPPPSRWCDQGMALAVHPWCHQCTSCPGDSRRRRCCPPSSCQARGLKKAHRREGKRLGTGTAAEQALRWLHKPPHPSTRSLRAVSDSPQSSKVPLAASDVSSMPQDEGCSTLSPPTHQLPWGQAMDAFPAKKYPGSGTAEA